MKEAIKYSNQLILTFPPSVGDSLMIVRDPKDRMILNHKYLPSLAGFLYGQKAYLEFHTRDQSGKVGRDTHKYMNHNLLYSPHSYLFESMTLFKDTVESLNDSPLLIESREGFSVTDGSHHVMDFIIFFEIEDWSVLTLPADGAKKALFGFFFIKATAEFESLSFGFFTPVAQLKSCLTDVLPILGNYYISPLNRVFSTPWVLCDYRGDIILDQIACILCGVISCICNKGINLFVYPFEVPFRLLGKFFEELSIPMVCRRYLDSYRDRELCIGYLKMNLVAKEAEVFTLTAPSSMGIGFLSFYVRGIDGESKTLFLDQREGLSNKIHDNLGEAFLAESLSEVVEGVVVGGFSIGEPTEIAESSIVSESSCKVSFGGGVAEVDEQNGFEQRDWVIAFSTPIGVFIFSEVGDEGEVDLLV